MKKFFSLMCAVAIALSASAAPAKVLGKSKQAEAIEAVKTVKAHQTLPATSLQKAERAAVAFKAPQAKHDNYNVTIEEYAENYYATDNDVWVKLYDADGNIYYFDIVVAAGTQELALGQTYTLADMIVNYSYMRGANGKMEYVSASLTKTLVPYEEQQLVRFDAQFTDTLGNSYTLLYQEAPFIITGDTINVLFQEHMNKPIYDQGLCQVRTTIDTMDIAFTFPCAAGQPAGTYTEADMNLDYTFVNNLAAVEANCVVTENNGNINLVGNILAKDGNVYHVTMFFAVPTPQTYETITATNLVLDDSYASWFGIIIAYASNEDYEVEMYLDASNYLGTFDAEEVELSITGTNGEIEIYEGAITVVNTADGIAITGTVLSMDGVQYTLNLTYVKPEPTSTENLNLSGNFYVEDGYWQYVGVDANAGISLLAIADQIAGTYTAADLYPSYCYVGKFGANDTAWYVMVDANIAIAVSGTTGTITGTFLAQNEANAADVILFNLNLTGEVEEQGGGDENDSQEPFKHIFAEYEVDAQYAAQYNVLLVDATDADNNYISLEFNVAEGVTELPAGVYDIDESYEAGTVSAGSLDASQGRIYGSFAGSLDDEGYINVPLWLLVDGTVTVLDNGVIQVNAINTWGSVIECQLGAWPEGVENTNAAVEVSKRIVNGQLVIEKNGVKYNAVGTIVK